MNGSFKTVRDYGRDNSITVGPGCSLGDVVVTFFGDGHRLVVGCSVKMFSGEIVFQGQGNSFTVGDRSEIREHFQGSSLERGSRVAIGADCLMSNSIHIRNWDSHRIIDRASGLQVNQAADILIGDRVWVGEQVLILKGAAIGTDSVVGARAVVTRGVYPGGCVLAGNPARVVKTGIRWER